MGRKLDDICVGLVIDFVSFRRNNEALIVDLGAVLVGSIWFDTKMSSDFGLSLKIAGSEVD